LPSRIVARRGKADFTHRVNEAVERDHIKLRDVFRADEAGTWLRYVNEEAVSILRESRTNRDRLDSCEGARHLMDLTGLVLWLRVFFGKKPTPRTRGNEQCESTMARSEP
jgi:hypothetical protein